MLTTIALVKSAAVPFALAAVFVAIARRSANLWCLLASFLAGILGAHSLNNSILRALPAITPAEQLHVATARDAWLSGFAEAALPEELAKGSWILVLLLAWRRYPYRQGVLIGGLVGLGFALRENLTNALIAAEWRATAVLSHGAWGMILGDLLQRATTGPRWRLRGILWAFVPPVLLHGLADTSFFLVEAYESKTGLQPLGPDTNLALNPVLLLEMLVTLAAYLFSWTWAGRLIGAYHRRQPAGDSGEMMAKCASE